MVTRKLDLQAFNFEHINNLKWIIPSGEIAVKVFYSKVPAYWNLIGVGIDPGRNFGIATLDGKEAWVFVGSLPEEEEKWKYGLAAYELLSNPTRIYGKGDAVIEGSAYKEPYGQSDLAHIRMGFTLGLYYAGFSVAIVPPATIRANALGKGNLGGLEVWPDLPHNGADAFAVAIYAAGIRKGDQGGTDISS